MKLDSTTLKRAVRTFVAGFLGVYGLPALLGVVTGSQPLDTTALRAAAAAGLAAAVALVWNAWLDPSPLPSLKAERTKP